MDRTSIKEIFPFSELQQEQAKIMILSIGVHALTDFLHLLDPAFRDNLTYTVETTTPLPPDTEVVAILKHSESWATLKLVIQSEEFALVSPNQIPEFLFYLKKVYK